MARHIETEVLKKALSHYGVEDAIFRDEIEMYIDDTPTADVEEVKHGYWFFTEYDYFDCSVCGEAYYNGCESTKEANHRLETGYDLYRYCPHCGARMDGKQPKEKEIKCKECEFLMFSDCYGECSEGYKGIVSPDDGCVHGKRKKNN